MAELERKRFSDSYEILGINIVDHDNVKSISVVAGFTETFTIHGDFQGIVTQTAFMLIDLSDTVNWKHTNIDHINLEYIILEVDPDSGYFGEVKLGFLSNVDGDNGDFNQIIDIDMVKKSDLVIEVIEFGSHGLDCTLDHHFGPILANSALFQTDVNLKGPDGATSYPSGDGDLALLVERSAGGVDVSITIGYETIA